jgi:hypothetical protein
MRNNIMLLSITVISFVLAVCIIIFSLYGEKFNISIVATSLIASLIPSILVVLVLMFVFQNGRGNSAQYDNIREKLENQIFDIQKKLSSNEDQWRESFHLLLSAQNKPLNTNINLQSNTLQLNTFLSQFGIDNNIEIDKKLVFYLTPFSKESQSTFEVVKDVCIESGFKIAKGDEDFVGGDIFRHIIKHLACARIVIANIDGKNANVFYELGIAHAIGKPVILISKSFDVPFDIKGNNIVCYKDDDQLRVMLKSQIQKVLVEYYNCYSHV